MLFAVAASLILLTILISVWLFRRPKDFPPGPRGIPLAGYYPFIHSKKSYVLAEEFHKSYGPVTGTFFGTYSVIFVNGYEAVKEALANEAFNGRPDICYFRDRFDGKQLGLIFPEQEIWKDQRRFTLHHFRNLGFGKRSHIHVIEEEVENMIEEVLKTKEPFHIEKLLSISSVNIMWSLIGGRRFPTHDPRLNRLCQCISDIMRLVPVTGNMTVIFPFLRRVFPGYYQYNEVKKLSDEIKSFIQASIEEHKGRAEESEPGDFIGLYLKEMREPQVKPHFTEEQLLAVCFDLIAAAADTNTSVLAFTILFMCLYPEHQTRMQAELDAAVGRQRVPTAEDRVSLPYTEACIAEVMRMRAPGPIVVPHYSIRETTLMGYRIPKDSGIFINVRSVHMDPEYWGDPEVFRPERHIGPDGKLQKDSRILLFGKGKRSCLGESLARITTSVTIASLFHRFKLSLPSADPPPDTEGRLAFNLTAPEFRVVTEPRF